MSGITRDGFGSISELAGVLLAGFYFASWIPTFWGLNLHAHSTWGDREAERAREKAEAHVMEEEEERKVEEGMQEEKRGIGGEPGYV